jgi:hypothetical protein
MGATTSPLQEEGDSEKFYLPFGFVALANETAEAGILHFV